MMPNTRKPCRTVRLPEGARADEHLVPTARDWRFAPQQHVRIDAAHHPSGLPVLCGPADRRPLDGAIAEQVWDLKTLYFG